MADYELQIARFDSGTPFRTRTLAKTYLDTFDRHKYGQFVAVRYYTNYYSVDHSDPNWPNELKIEVLLAMGVKDFDNQEVGHGQAGEDMYVIIADTGDSGGGGGGEAVWNACGRLFKIDQYYTTLQDEDLENPEIPTPITRETIDDLDEGTLSEYIYYTLHRKVFSLDVEQYVERDGDLCVLEVQPTPDFQRTMYVSYVYDANANSGEGLWKRLGVVAETDVVFTQGVRRTAAIGVRPEVTQIVTEGKGMTLKQLLEYYLVEEKWPTDIIASWNVPILGEGFSMSLANTFPNLSLKNGVTFSSNKAVVEVGTTLQINNTYSWTPNVIVSRVHTDGIYVHGPATIENLLYGANPAQGYATFTDTTMTGYDQLSVHSTVNGDANRMMNININTLFNNSSINIVNSNTSVPETSNSTACIIGSEILSKHSLDNTTTHEGTYSIKLSMIANNCIWKESWNAGSLNGVGAASEYLSNTGNTRLCSTILPDVTGVYTIPAGFVSSTINSLAGYSTYTVISVFPLFTNGKYATKVDYKAYDQDNTIAHNPQYSSTHEGWCTGGASATSASDLTKLDIGEPNTSNELYYNVYMGNCDHGEIRRIFLPIKHSDSSQYTWSINRVCVWDTFNGKWIEIYSPTIAESTQTVADFVVNGKGGNATYRIFEITKKLGNLGPLANGAMVFNISILRSNN